MAWSFIYGPLCACEVCNLDSKNLQEHETMGNIKLEWA